MATEGGILVKAEQIKAKYAELEMCYGADAPVAMLRFCGLATNTLDDQLQALVPYLKEQIVSREIAAFRANQDGGGNAMIEAYERCAAEVRTAIGTAVWIEIMAPQDDEG